MISIILSLILLLTPCGVESTVKGNAVTFRWDAGEEIVDGYRIYFGRVSRFEPWLQLGIDDHIISWCGRARTDERRQGCIDSWDNYCPQYDFRSCDADYYTYEYSIDVGLVTTATIDDLEDGVWYFAVVSYDNEATYNFFVSQPPESRFSDELAVVIDTAVVVEEPEPEPEPEPPPVIVPPEPEPEPPPVVVPPEPEPEPIIEEPIIEEPIKPTPIKKKKKKRKSNGGCFINTLRGD